MSLRREGNRSCVDCISLPREENGSCVSGEEVESKYDGMERAEDRDCEGEDEDRERENGGQRKWIVLLWQGNRKRV